MTALDQQSRGGARPEPCDYEEWQDRISPSRKEGGLGGRLWRGSPVHWERGSRQNRGLGPAAGLLLSWSQCPWHA